jgi:hypothetical protein
MRNIWIVVIQAVLAVIVAAAVIIWMHGRLATATASSD